MSVNDLTFNQLATVLTSIVGQATGTSPITPVNTGDFVTVAQTALKNGYDPLATAISQVLSKTIFSVRPYSQKFRGLEADAIRWGNHVRKLQTVDGPIENDDRFALADGESIDQYIVRKPEVLQTNFYGSNVWQKHLTIYKDQLDNAFNGPDQFASFLGMVMQNARDQITQSKESVARSTLANFIGGKIANDSKNVLHLVTMYNDEKGTELTTDSVMQVANFKPFIEWMYAKIQTIADFLSERSLIYHTNITDKPIMRHTPYERLKCYMYNPLMNNVYNSVFTNVFNERFLKMVDFESVNYWQSIENPDGISVTPTYLDASGNLTTATEPVTESNIVGVLFDEEAAGITTVNEWSAVSPFNARGGYYNQFWHFTTRYWNDFTENGVVLILD